MRIHRSTQSVPAPRTAVPDQQMRFDIRIGDCPPDPQTVLKGAAVFAAGLTLGYALRPRRSERTTHGRT